METSSQSSSAEYNKTSAGTKTDSHGEKEETGFSQPVEYEDENGAGGSLGIETSDDDEEENEE
ncbi:MAG TPA: hypothetical protein VF581_01680 [Flavobacterium sp.]|jgi:hypothetical protein